MNYLGGGWTHSITLVAKIVTAMKSVNPGGGEGLSRRKRICHDYNRNERLQGSERGHLAHPPAQRYTPSLRGT